MGDKLGLIAGGGALPGRVIDSCLADGRQVFVVALEGHARPDIVDRVPHVWIPLGAAGRGLEALRSAGCRDLVMVGPVRRPSLRELRPDWRAAKFFSRLGRKALGDDGLLRAVADALESEGFNVLTLHDLLDDCLAPAGTWTRSEPDDTAWEDIRRGVDVARTLGRADVGQAVIVQQGLVLGVEAIEGTDALIRRCEALHRVGRGGILVKVAKPEQDARSDLPTIGSGTVNSAAACGLRGIAVGADRTLVVDFQVTVEAADAAGLFLYGMPGRDS